MAAKAPDRNQILASWGRVRKAREQVRIIFDDLEQTLKKRREELNDLILAEEDALMQQLLQTVETTNSGTRKSQDEYILLMHQMQQMLSSGYHDPLDKGHRTPPVGDPELDFIVFDDKAQEQLCSSLSSLGRVTRWKREITSSSTTFSCVTARKSASQTSSASRSSSSSEEDFKLSSGSSSPTSVDMARLKQYLLKELSDYKNSEDRIGGFSPFKEGVSKSKGRKARRDLKAGDRVKTSSSYARRNYDKGGPGKIINIGVPPRYWTDQGYRWMAQVVWEYSGHTKWYHLHELELL